MSPFEQSNGFIYLRDRQYKFKNYFYIKDLFSMLLRFFLIYNIIIIRYETNKTLFQKGSVALIERPHGANQTPTAGCMAMEHFL